MIERCVNNRFFRRESVRAAFGAEGANVSLQRALILAALALSASQAHALDPARAISQYGHMSWTLQDGVLPGAPTAMAQTLDGYLWIGTRGGLVRFDGVRFVAFTTITTQKLRSSRVLSLEAGNDGSLWIGTRASLERWRQGRLTRIDTPRGQIASIAEDRNGTIWFTRMSVQDKQGPLCEIRNEQAVCHGVEDGVPIEIGRQLIADEHGALWTVSDHKLMRWRSGSSRTWTPPGVKAEESVDVVHSLELARDGSVWVGAMLPARGLGLLRLVDDELQSYVTPQLDGRKLSVSPMLEDRNGALWIGTQDDGVYRLHEGSVSHYGSAQGLSADTVQGLFEDREGTIWVLTTNGVDSFRDLRIASITSREGLSADLANGVLATRSGDVWINTWHWLDVLRNGRIVTLKAHVDFPGEQVLSMYEDRDGVLWMGIDNGLFVHEDGRFKPVKRPNGSPMGFTRGITQDAAGDIWAMTGNPPDSVLTRIRDRRLVEERTNIPFELRTLVADPRGGIWFALTNGDVGKYHEGHTQSYSYHREPGAGAVNALVVLPDGAVVGSTSTAGLVGVRDDQARTLGEANGLPCSEVHSMLADRHGGLWLYASCGVILIAADQMQIWWREPDAVLKFRVFDALDGAQPARGNFFPNASVGPDGRLWFANASVAQVIDPDHLHGNPLAPPVHIERVMADRQAFAAEKDLRLPPLTRDLQIDYTALSMVAPRKVQFRYRLEGHDSAWQEAGSRRQAFYTDLPPGDYRFQVTASNNDGVWNDAGAVLKFSVTPTFYQTTWFAALCVVAAGGLLWLAYLLRVRQITLRERARFEERLAERTRLARELHDTLLQTIQGSKLVAEHALDSPTDAVRLRRSMEQLSHWLGQAVREGREALRALRGPAAGLDDLAAALKRAAENTRIDGAMQISCVTAGAPRELHAIVADEIYRIGYEAIRNACLHSGAGKLSIEVVYADEFTLRISDDGRGIDPETIKRGRQGHFGLQGMHERAAHIGGVLTVRAAEGAGTRVELVLPADALSRK